MIFRFGNNVPGFCPGRPKWASLLAKVDLWSCSPTLWQVGLPFTDGETEAEMNCGQNWFGISCFDCGSNSVILSRNKESLELSILLLFSFTKASLSNLLIAPHCL